MVLRKFSYAPPPLHAHLQGRAMDSQAKVGGSYFLIVPAVQKKCEVLTLGSLPNGDFLLQSKVLTSSLPPGVGASAGY